MNAAPNAFETAFAPLGFAPGQVLRVFGMRRSGNHAIINWLLRNAAGNSVFLNNCKIRKDPFTTHAAVEVNRERRIVAEDHPLASVTAEVGDGAMFVISYEDCLPVAPKGALLSAGIENELIDQDLLLYRKFMNWSASLLKKIQGNERYSVTERLRIMLTALERYRALLGLVIDSENNGLIPICYEEWLDRPRYRIKLLRDLGIEPRDNSLGDVQPYGGGSSFEDKAASGLHLDSAERWHLMVDSPDFQLLLMIASQDEVLLERMDQVMKADAGMLRDFTLQARFPFEVQVGGDA